MKSSSLEFEQMDCQFEPMFLLLENFHQFFDLKKSFTILVTIWQRLAKSGEFGLAIWQNSSNFEEFFFKSPDFTTNPSR
jgi:hypothetical protein